MSMGYYTGNQRKAAQIARRMVRELTPTDIDAALVREHMNTDDERRLFAAVHSDYVKNQKRLHYLIDKLSKGLSGELEKIFDEYEDRRVREVTAREIAGFNLGWAAALRLLGVDEKKGGKR